MKDSDVDFDPLECAIVAMSVVGVVLVMALMVLAVIFDLRRAPDDNARSVGTLSVEYVAACSRLADAAAAYLEIAEEKR